MEIFTKKNTYKFNLFNLLTEQRSKLRKSQSFYTPAPSFDFDKNKSMSKKVFYFFFSINLFLNFFLDFCLNTETRGIRKKIEFEMEIKKNEEVEKAFRSFKAQPFPDYNEMVFF